MLKRIISGVVLALIAAAAVFLNNYTEIPIIAFVTICAAFSTYEVLYNTKVLKKRGIAIAAAIFSAVYLPVYLYNAGIALALTFVYAAVVAVVSLIFFDDFEFQKIAAVFSFPIILPMGFVCLEQIFVVHGIKYLLLLLNFACICDTCAYFTGVALGKHKLCEKISPKKTVEGAVGGIAGSVIATAIISLCFGISGAQMVILLVATPFMCVIGMVGDLFASAIKRSVGIKDFGKILPGHGGILDRFDSILLISPVFYLLLSWRTLV